jgi:hypothetical protein
VDKITNGKGQQWMDKYLSGITIGHHDSPGNVAFPGGVPFQPSGGAIYLNKSWINSSAKGPWPPIQALAHELGHIADCNSGAFLFYHCVGGAADQLNNAIGGDVSSNNVWNCRWCQPSGWPKDLDENIPAEFQWSASVNGGYGNGATADYFAEAFSWSIYDPSKLPHAPTVEVLVWVIIMNQASTLP